MPLRDAPDRHAPTRALPRADVDEAVALSGPPSPGGPPSAGPSGAGTLGQRWWVGLVVAMLTGVAVGAGGAFWMAQPTPLPAAAPGLERELPPAQAATSRVEAPSPAPPVIRHIQVVDRKADRVTIRWKTDREAGTELRVGDTRDYSRGVEDPRQVRSLEHSIVVRGLTPNTTYHFQVRSPDPDDPRVVGAGPDKRFVTRAASREAESPKQMAELLGDHEAYLAKLTPEQRARRDRLIRGR